jgi:hypothetical protein
MRQQFLQRPRSARVGMMYSVGIQGLFSMGGIEGIPAWAHDEACRQECSKHHLNNPMQSEMIVKGGMVLVQEGT